MDPTTTFCPNVACPARGQTGQGNVETGGQTGSRESGSGLSGSPRHSQHITTACKRPPIAYARASLQPLTAPDVRR